MKDHAAKLRHGTEVTNVFGGLDVIDPEDMETIIVTLRITWDRANLLTLSPHKWDYHTLLDLAANETVEVTDYDYDESFTLPREENAE